MCIRHRAPEPAEGPEGSVRMPMSGSGVLMVLDWIVLRDPPSPLPGRVGLARASWFLMFFWYRLGTSFFRILVPTWPQFASQLGPKILPKSSQEPSKIHPNIDLIIDHFFYWFFIDFSLIFDPKIIKKSMKNLLKNHPNNITPKSCRCPWNPIKTNTFLRFLLCRQCYVKTKNQ